MRGDAARPRDAGRREHEPDAQKRRQAADVLNPLPDREPADVRRGDQREPRERHRGNEHLLIHELGGARFAAGERENPRHVDEEHRHVEQVVGPIAPAGEKPVRVAEFAARPEIDAALSGMPPREDEDGDRLGDEESGKRDRPQYDRRPAVHGDRRNIVDVDDGDDLQQHEIPAPERARNRRVRRDRHRSRPVPHAGAPACRTETTSIARPTTSSPSRSISSGITSGGSRRMQLL